MKKKEYLQQIERGALIGTSVLLLNGVVSCSFDPMDTPPTETTLTKGPGGGAPGGLPGGLPGSSITYYPAGQTPVLLQENKKSGFIMTDGYCSFSTTIPYGYSGISITMNEDESGYTRKVTKVEALGYFPNFSWTKGSALELGGFRLSTSQNKPPIDLTIKIHSVDKSPVVLYFTYTL